MVALPYFFAASLGSVVAFKIFWSLLRSHLVAKHCAIGDIQELGKARPDGAKIRGTAVVCGGSYAGLATARVLADHFERVVIIEPEEWLLEEDARRAVSWEQEGKRARIVQYNSLQATQPFVLRTMRYLFPNWDATCKEGGIEIAPYELNFMWWGNTAQSPRKYFGGVIPDAMFVSRRALETAIRRRVLDVNAYPNISQVAGQVTNFIMDKNHSDRVGGVTYRDINGNTTDIHAELVADCTGTAQGSLKWLPQAGFTEEIKKDTYDAKMRYTTFTFKITPELGAKLPVPGGFYRQGGGYLVSNPDARTDNKYICILRNEGNLVSVCPGGWGGTGAPLKTVDDIVAHCKALKFTTPMPQWIMDYVEMLHEAEHDMVVSQVNVGPSFLLKFHEAKNLPTNYVCLGDVLCRVNPLYGHGCAKALTGASCINMVLNRTRSSPVLPRSFAKDFFKLHAEKLVPMWELPILMDYGHETTVPIEGQKKSDTDGLRWYLRQVFELSFKDEDAFLPSFLTITLMGGASIDLLHPVLIAKVMWNYLRG
ncbi:hypothetical protein CYLTODRAFT_367537 [Cylindrobasidium torrendii FP15055 ss-10]|uniref:FAD/NAD(P)-binding domain-containing protein n=1 Tax=Cylindrobasidium torrendii FP15055 ss-10 TaxID=1314674 RepID=A0A0D7BQJ4_9AGAR|nr:hypothetical protein CYLTODRAFT_367537 [Cylindrobasidium torrendii FP15055 ss-10]